VRKAAQQVFFVLTTGGKNSIIKQGVGNTMLSSEKAFKIINKQKPIAQDIINRVKDNLTKKGVLLDQSEELDRYLISTGKEAVTFPDGSIIMHTKVSASGFYEELIHYGQIKSGHAVYNDPENNMLMEIEAKRKLIKYQKAYKITDYEIGIIKNVLNDCIIELENFKKGGL